MGKTPTDAYHLQFKVPGSTSRIENPSVSISESITDPRLPHDLITEILLRLPVKSLLKFKCTSKSWLSRISSPQFTKSHFSTSCKEGEYLNHQLLFTVLDPTPRMKQCSLYSALHKAEPLTFVSDFEHLYQNSHHAPWIVGIVNGLLCLAINATELCLWNPALRKFKHLPSPIVNLEPPFTSVAVNYGFGYDESNDDYKVVCVLRLCGSEGAKKDEVKFYSLRADSWRRNDEGKGFFPIYDSAAIYAIGKMYWAVDEPGEPGDSTQTRKIVSLDMASEKCGELQQPDYEPGYFNWKLGVVCGRPFVLCDYNGMKLDLWVMDKYGVEESWCKMGSIPIDDVYRRTPYSHERVVCFISNDEIVIRNGRGLLVYHTKHKKCRNIELDVGKSYFKVVPYVESLVSPDGSNV